MTETIQITECYEDGLQRLLDYKRNQRNLTSWFLYQELKMQVREEIRAAGNAPDDPMMQADILCECVRRMPLSIPSGSAIAGTQDDAFSPSYALINPNFKVETFSGYCDPLAVYNDIKPTDDIPTARIEKVRAYWADTDYVRSLGKVYEKTGLETSEVAYFVEHVTGHIIPDLRPVLELGIDGFTASLPEKSAYSGVMKNALEASKILAARYAVLAEDMAARTDAPEDRALLRRIAENCRRVPAEAATNLHEAVQAFALLWQAMCLEQAPNPYAFSVGNLDRILQPHLHDTPRDEAVQLVRHLLAFFMVGDRCWAISQNLMVAGRDADGTDLSCEMTQIVLDAFYRSNLPQPALSVKLHRKTPEALYRSMGRFFFTPGHSTPSVFNDDEVFEVLRSKGIEEADLADYGIAGCQEPLIMGKESGNTTNSWLNLAKILELVMNDGRSLISGEKIGLSWQELGFSGSEEAYRNLPEAFYRQLDTFLQKMETAANECTCALGKQAAPFTSSLMGCLHTGRDIRNPEAPGVKYNSSGCLIHGLSVVVDSFVAVEAYLDAGIGDPDALRSALQNDFQDAADIRDFLLSQDKYGNRIAQSDTLAAEVADTVCQKISALRNPAGNPFRPDFSTPSTHLLYGYWVGATPDGRGAREMLGYGIDPLPGAARGGLQDRLLSARKLPFRSMSGGYASHFGLSPRDFTPFQTMEEKGLALKSRLIDPLFAFNNGGRGGYYVYFNVDDPGHLRKVLAQPKKYAPNGIYIMRIHGTFVNFLDLSPAIQEDIITRLDMN